jgi:hypothetical protein
MMRKVKLLACLLPGVAVPLLLTFPTPAASDEQFQVTATVDVGPITSFDISFVDANIHTLVQSHRDASICGTNPSTGGGVDVIDTNNNKLVKTLCGFHGATKEHGPNGVIIVDQKEVWAGDGLSPGGASSLKVFDIATGKMTDSINTGGVGRSDELCEAVGREIVMIANDRDADLFVSFWDTESHKMLGKLFFTGGADAMGINAHSSATQGGGIEQCKFDPRTQKFLLALPQPSSPAVAGIVAVISPETFKVVDFFKVDPSCDQGPHGLALGPDHQVLLGCGSPSAASLIIDDRNGKTIFTLPGASTDEAWYNPGDNHYFEVPTNAAGTAGTLVPIDAATGAEDAPATANGSSRVVAADMLKNQIYVVLPGPDDVASGGSGKCPIAANGCIGVYTAKNDDHCLARGMPVLDHDDGDDPVFMRTRCDDDRQAENDRDR